MARDQSLEQAGNPLDLFAEYDSQLLQSHTQPGTEAERATYLDLFMWGRKLFYTLQHKSLSIISKLN
jgi:hypothetical protein